MNILLSSSGFFPHSFGGGEVYVYRLAKELLRRGHILNVVTPAQWSERTDLYVSKKYLYEDIPVISFAVNPEKAAYAEAITGFGPAILNVLRYALEKYLPELIHINGMKPAMVRLCNDMQIPHVVTAHHTGIVCPAGGLVRPDGSVCDQEVRAENCVPCCNALRRPKWYTGGLIGRIPSWIYRSLGERLSKSRKLNYIERGLITPWLVEKAMAEKKATVQNAQLLIAPSKFMRDLLVRNGCSPEKVVVIPHGIEPLGKTPPPISSGKPTRFGYMGRVDPSKGLHVLLKAAELLPGNSLCEIHIFGAARNLWHEAYRKKILSDYRGKARVVNHGLVPHDSLREVYDQIDVLVVPSLLPEAFGLVVAEAFSAGRPAIVFNSGALPELVTHGRDGLIVQDNSGKSLAAAMQMFVEDPGLINKMSAQIPHVRTIQEHVDELGRLYQRLLSSRVSTTRNEVYK